LDTTSLVIGPLTVVRGAAWDGSRDAPPLLAGSVAGIIAVLRVDPTEASMIFRRRRLADTAWTVTFGTAHGLLTYWVLEPERIVVLLDLTWAG
jgi:hypothetical protein